MTGAPRIEAAGAVLWRHRNSEAVTGPADVEVAVVHRPKYDDWSLPKGKLTAGEHPLLAATREVEEETGFGCLPGRPLGAVHYDTAAGPKRVRYWAARATTGRFQPGREVDELRWLPAEDALAMLDADRDRGVLHGFLADTRPTRATVVVRHASAGDRQTWSGEDRLRPLDDRGRRQAQALTGLLTTYDVSVALAPDVLRCRETLEPFARTTGTAVQTVHRVSADCYGRDPDAGADLLHESAVGAEATVLCAQREVIPDLLARTCTRLGQPTAAVDIGQVPRASLVVLHVDGDARLVAREWLPAP